MPDLEGKVAVVTGASRGLGRAIAATFAAEGANVALLARTEEPHPRIVGTIIETADAIRAAGGTALPVRCNVGNAEEVKSAMERVLAELGGVDILVHNAAANFPGRASEMDPGRWDILMNVNPRAMLNLVHGCLDSLKERGGHILSVSPKPETSIGDAAPYTLSKQLQTRLTLGLASELADYGVAANCLWPDGQRTTEGYMMMRGGFVEGMLTTQIFADAALAIVSKPPADFTGRAVLDIEVLREEGVTDLSRYEPSDEVKALRYR